MFTFAIALIWGLLTGNAHTYGYSSPTATNQGIYVQFDATHCVGYETSGAPGFFGNVLGLTGGDCS